VIEEQLMTESISPATQSYLGVPGYIITLIIVICGLALFSYTIYKRYLLLRSGQPDPRFSSLGKRLVDLLVYGIIQKRQPRYFWAGLLHLMIFWGFVVLGLRSIELVGQGLKADFVLPLMQGGFGSFYDTLKDFFELIVLVACTSAILRRAIGRPARYEVKNGKGHAFEAYFVLSLIIFLMVTDMFFEGSGLVLGNSSGSWLPAANLAVLALPQISQQFATFIHLKTYWLHILSLFFFLNFLPLSKHFHIITALPNVFFRKLDKGTIKPARWGVENIEELENLGVEKFEHFTWKHILDFFTCTECGRCSDNCPATTVGRPLSPKMITLKLREHGYRKLPVFGATKDDEDSDPPMVGGLITEDEIWSCTTCGACEEECPVFIEYIDKMIDMRRHLVETSSTPAAFSQTLMNVEKTGNPFGKPPSKRADWIKELPDLPVKILKEGDEAEVLFFVDSYGSYDPRVQSVASAIATGLHRSGVSFGILGPREKDSGHQVRRMGEEGLFQFLVEENVETLQNCDFRQIITTDPHAFNTLKNDYPGPLRVSHYTEFFLSMIEQGRLTPTKRLNDRDVYTYHDPCYLGRHNGVYDQPRKILRSLPGLNLVEMKRSRDKSFCCGGGDINLWHEIEQEEMRMAEKRLNMVMESGANVLVTACPFCLLNFEDTIKTRGLKDKVRVVDLMELLISTL
jgi:Fe-S oxidoreductase